MREWALDPPFNSELLYKEQCAQVVLAETVMNVLRLDPATPAENDRALQEVQDFALTDMGRDGRERWTYRILSEPLLTEELARVCYPKTFGNIDSVTLQPCTSAEARSQDRYIVNEWEFPGGKWTFTAVFDGHANPETVDYALAVLPPLIKQSLASIMQRASSSRQFPPAAVISSMLSSCVVRVDDTITSEFLSLFPGGPAAVSRISEERIREIINDRATGGRNYMKTIRCLRGTTALVALVDPSRTNIWVANLGDCYAVLGSRDKTSRSWTGTLLNSIQNGSNPEERARIRREHPGETDECVINERIVGFLAPTRVIGDTWLKLPAIYSQRVFLNLDEGWNTLDMMDEFVARIRTPPYVSNIPETRHYTLRPELEESFLILCSDGLPEIYEDHDDINGMLQTIQRWVDVVGKGVFSRRIRGSSNCTNLAMLLLRDALGGKDTHAVSRNLTVEMDERWIDDITIIVMHSL